MAFCAAAYIALMLAILLKLDPAFFYPRIETDQLLYLLKAKALVETGSTQASIAVNTPPFSYAAMPGVIRAPFMILFSEFDHQLRAMQILNVIIVTLTAIMGAYMLSWALPQRAHALAVGFPFLFVLLSPDWLANVFVPLADAPYAMLTLACLLVSISVLTSPKPVAEQRAAVAGFAALFITGFMVRFTAPVLFVPIALLARGRFRGLTLDRRQKRLLVGIPLALLATLAVINADAIFGKYIGEPFYFVFMADKVGMALNLFASALPAQIVPVFNLGYEVMPPTSKLRPEFGTTPRDIAWVIVGLCISAVLILGIVRSTRRFFPEIAYLLVILPVLGVMIPSTTRYLMSYQPMLWVAFAIGLAHVTRPLRRRVSATQVKAVALAAAVVVIVGLAMLRSARTARTASRAAATSALERPLQYTAEVAETYRGLRNFLETLPPDQSLIVTSGGEAGRWTVIAHRAHYVPDTTMKAVVSQKDLYSVLSCGTPASCQYFDAWYSLREKRLAQYGRFDYRKVFETSTGSARATVYRITSSAPAGGQSAQSASGLTAR